MWCQNVLQGKIKRMIAISQPNYFPWLGYFELFARSDKFIFLDDVQWIRQGRQHRCRIPGGTFEEKNWLTLPVKGHGHRGKSLAQMEIDHSQNWQKEHRNTLHNVLGDAPYYQSQVVPLLEGFFEKTKDEKLLVRICEESIFSFWDLFDLKTELHWSSDLLSTTRDEAKAIEFEKSERLILLCQKFQEKEYYAALGGTKYVDMAQFRAAGVRVRWQHFRKTFPGDFHRPVDHTVLDWLAQVPVTEIKLLLASLPPIGSDANLL